MLETDEPKGEYVLVIEGADENELKRKSEENYKTISIEDHMEMYTSRGIDRKEAMKLVAKDRGVSKRDIYDYLMK